MHRCRLGANESRATAIEPRLVPRNPLVSPFEFLMRPHAVVSFTSRGYPSNTPLTTVLDDAPRA